MGMTLEKIKDVWMKTETDIKKKRTVKRVALRPSGVMVMLMILKSGCRYQNGRTSLMDWMMRKAVTHGTKEEDTIWSGSLVDSIIGHVLDFISTNDKVGRQCIVDASLPDTCALELE